MDWCSAFVSCLVSRGLLGSPECLTWHAMMSVVFLQFNPQIAKPLWLCCKAWNRLVLIWDFLQLTNTQLRLVPAKNLRLQFFNSLRVLNVPIESSGHF